MRARTKTLVLVLVLAALVLLAAACGGGDDSTDAAPPPAEPAGTGADTQSEPAPAPAPEPAPAPAPEPAAEPAPAPSASAGPLTTAFADGWNVSFIDEGIKPDLDLTDEDSPGITYLSEALDGWVRYADAAGGWAPETVAEGYFYGPIGLAYDPSGRPNIAYHDHQGSELDLDLGDLTYALRDGGTWTVEAASDPGHDGWDSTIEIADDGVVRAAGVEPSQFGLENGVEYYERRDGAWTATPVGSGPIAYEFNVSLAIDPNGNPAISYYNDGAGELWFASFDGSSWSTELVTAEGDPGRFSSLVFDADGRPHISFYNPTSASSGTVGYAVKDGGSWTVEDLGTLDDVSLGMVGARRNSAIALDSTGAPHVMFSDESGIWYASRGDGGWDVQQIADASAGNALGQLVSFRLDSSDTPHLTYFEVTSAAPLTGLVGYATPSQ